MTEAHVFCGDVIDIIDEIEDDYFDAVFCDPPYGISFMGRKWDHGVPSAEVWREVMRVLKPGGHLMVFGGTRTYHRLAVAIEDAGFEIRDSLMWLYGSGFPKSHNISKALDKKAGAEREVIGESEQGSATGSIVTTGEGALAKKFDITAPATPAATLFDGYGTALKPAYEPIVLAMKPKAGTYADNALKHGVAGLNIDGGRVWTDEKIPAHHGTNGGEGLTYGARADYVPGSAGKVFSSSPGRFPANLILDEQAGELLDEQAGDEKSRFFYTAKASKAEREAGLDDMKKVCGTEVTGRKKGDKSSANASAYTGTTERKRANTHPCVKPLDLCRYFCTMLLPPKRSDDQRKILVPFSGSGSEMIGAMQAGWDFIVGIEKEEKYCEIAEQRIAYWKEQ